MDKPEAECRCDSERVHRDIGDADHDRQHQQCHDDRRDADGDGQEGGNETAEDNHEHSEQDGQRDALADDEIVTDPVLDLHRHAKGAACTHVGRRVVGRQLFDYPDRRLCGLVKGPAHVHEDETGAPVPAA